MKRFLLGLTFGAAIVGGIIAGAPWYVWVIGGLLTLLVLILANLGPVWPS